MIKTELHPAWKEIRANLKRLFGVLTSLAEEFNAPVLVTNQVVANLSNRFNFAASVAFNMPFLAATHLTVSVCSPCSNGPDSVTAVTSENDSSLRDLNCRLRLHRKRPGSLRFVFIALLLPRDPPSVHFVLCAVLELQRGCRLASKQLLTSQRQGWWTVTRTQLEEASLVMLFI